MYVVVLNKSNRVVKKGSKPFKGLSDNVKQIEVESVPNIKDGQYLIYEGGELIVKDIEYTESQLKCDYEKLIESLIRKKYSISNELAILRKRDTKVQEFNEYYAYVEEAKRVAKAKIYR